MDGQDIKRASRGVAGRELYQEIASRATDPDFIKGMEYLPNPDRVLLKLGYRENVFEDIQSDGHVWADVQQRKSATLSEEWVISPASGGRADKKAAALCKEVFDALNLRQIMSGLLDAPLHGRAYAEVMWARDGGMIIPEKVLDRPQRRFVYAPGGELRLLTQNDMMEGEPVPDHKFIQARQFPTYDNPYGQSALSRCFWPWTFKHNDLKFWIILAEKFGNPFLWGKVARGASDEEIAALLDALVQMGQDGVGVSPGDGSVEILEAAASAKGDMHAQLVSAMNAEISKALIGQTLTTEIDGKGSYAAAKEHQNVRSDLADSDQEIVAEALSDLCQSVTEINVPNATAPRFEFIDEEAHAEWLKHLSGAVKIGVQVPLAWAHKKLSIPMPGEGEDVLESPETSAAPTAPTPTGFSREGRRPDGLVEFAFDASDASDANDRLARAAADAAGDDLAKLSSLVAGISDEAQSFDELKDRLARGLSNAPLETLAETFARTVFVAELNGRVSVEAEAEAEFTQFAEPTRGMVFKPLPFGDAIRAFRSLVTLSPDEFGALGSKAAAAGFSVAGDLSMKSLERVRSAIDEALSSGTTLADFKKQVRAIVAEQGLSPLGAHHIETVFRQNVLGAYSAGRYRQMRRPEVLARRPLWQYRTAGDDDVRDSHRALDGKVFRADDKVWDEIYPPNGYRCRCEVVTLSERQAERRGITVEKGADVVGHTTELDGRLVQVRPDDGWNHNPAQQIWEPDLSLYPEPMRAEYEKRRAAWLDTVEEE